MKKNIYVELIMLIAAVSLSSCRGGSAKKAIDIVKKYSGKVFKSSEKKSLMFRYGDDVVRHLNFQKVSCSDCGGDGETWSGTCGTCSGDGYVCKIQSK